MLTVVATMPTKTTVKPPHHFEHCHAGQQSMLRNTASATLHPKEWGSLRSIESYRLGGDFGRADGNDFATTAAPRSAGLRAESAWAGRCCPRRRCVRNRCRDGGTWWPKGRTESADDPLDSRP